jgi:dihydroorotate dehydrogenase
MIFSFARPFLHRLDPEVAHTATVRVLGWLPRFKAPPFHPMLAQNLFGLNFASPIGLAAGFDKNADVPDAMLSFGFGFTEVGTITPQAQPGNPTPRIFRLREDEAVINRLGFNNKGLAAACAKLRSRKNIGIVGVNIGANKTTEDKIADYVLGIHAVRDFASYITINISSPNTPGLRALQSRSALAELVDRCLLARGAHKVPMLIKIAPDLTPEDIDDIATVAITSKIEGLIVSNTTITRPESLRSEAKYESGGLSGAPLFTLSTQTLRDVAIATQRKIPLIGVGGVANTAQAYAKIRAGASLVQLYSGLIYHGPGLAKRIAVDLPKFLVRDGFSHLQDAIGADLPSFAKKAHK